MHQYYKNGSWKTAFGDAQTKRLVESGAMEHCKSCGAVIWKCCGYCHTSECQGERVRVETEAWGEDLLNLLKEKIG